MYSFFTSIYYFFRFIFFSIKEKSFRLLRYYPGHYSSPVPGKDALYNSTLFSMNASLIEGVDLNKDYQLMLLESFFGYHKEFNCPERQQSDRRYYYDNPMYGYNDAYIYYCFLRKFKPKNLIEIGSGYSSALLLDAIDLLSIPDINLTFIEPYPDRLFSLLIDKDHEKTDVIENHIQNVSAELFNKLGKDDILFVDTSHVLKIGSDLSKIIFSILPALNKGVIVHFHDIFWPFEYPKVIFDDGRLWNESYFLRSFLQYNNSFEILFFTSYLENLYKEKITEKFPEFSKSTGSSLWIRKNN